MSDLNSPEIENPQDRLSSLRTNLSEVDSALLRLIARRRAIAGEVAAAKAVLGLPAFVPVQHFAVRQRIRVEAIELGVDPDLANAVHDPLLLDSVAIQELVLGQGASVPTASEMMIVE
jgi:chorismate mutase/prephenate dehydrogenase